MAFESFFSMATEQSTKQQFIFGLVTGVAVISFAGLLTLLLRGGTDTNEATVAGEQAETQEVAIPKVEEDDHIRGSFDAPVKIVEYTDLECPYCKRNHGTLQQLMSEYGDDVAWVVRNFPLYKPDPTGRILHSQAGKEAEAIECAGELGGNDAFWALTDKIFEVTPGNNGLDLALVPDMAVEAGLDKEEFTQCWESGKYAKKVEGQYNDALAAGAQGTPYNIIVGPDGETTPLAGAYPIEDFRAVIDPLLAK